MMGPRRKQTACCSLFPLIFIIIRYPGCCSCANIVQMGPASVYVGSYWVGWAVGGGWLIILLHKPQRSGSSVCHRLERRVKGPLETGGLRITEIGSNFEKWLSIRMPHTPSSPTLTFHSLPPTAQHSALLVNNLIKRERERREEYKMQHPSAQYLQAHVHTQAHIHHQILCVLKTQKAVCVFRSVSSVSVRWCTSENKSRNQIQRSL